MGRIRLTISALLLASAAAVAVPAMAQDMNQDGGNHGNRGGGHDGRGDGGDHGADRGGGRQQEAQPQGQQRPQGQPQAQQRPQAQPQGQQRPQANPGDRGGGTGWQPRGDAQRGGNDGRHVSGRPDNGVQVWRNNDRGQAQQPDGQRGGDQGRPGGWNGDRSSGQYRGQGQYQGQGQYRGQGRDQGHGGNWDRGDRGSNNWNRGWRQDNRYDWQSWRNTHRSYYRAGQYRTPYGYHGGYRRWGIGVRIDPIFFGQDYWIDNPDYYRLPPAYGDYRWVRYYNDALLIDVYSGTVMDEIPNFFW